MGEKKQPPIRKEAANKFVSLYSINEVLKGHYVMRTACRRAPQILQHVQNAECNTTLEQYLTQFSALGQNISCWYCVQSMQLATTSATSSQHL